MVRKKSWMSNIIVHSVFLIAVFLCLVPFLMVLSVSFSQESDILKYGYNIIPKNFTFFAYKFVVSNPQQLIKGYQNSLVITIFGTVIGVALMSMTAYCLSRKNFEYRKIIMFFLFFSMLFSGGLVPTYILVTKYLRLDDSMMILILSGLINVYHIIILRTFFGSLPEALFESAKLDGANEFRIFWQIAVPLSTPAIATVALLGALYRWNDWYTPLLYIKSSTLMPLQYLLYQIMANIQFMASNMDTIPLGIMDSQVLPAETARMAMCVLAAGPMMFIFPFFQKYFVQGLTVGSIKG